MRTKDEILTSTRVSSKAATSPIDISLIHELHMLEVLIDIRDAINEINDGVLDKLMEIAKIG